MDTPKDKILNIVDRIGMSTTIAAKAMNIAENTFRKNKSDTLPRNNFTENNYNDLIDFLIGEIKFLIDYKNENTEILQSYEMVVDKYFHIFKNYAKYSKQEGWILFDELKLIVDAMEKGEAFNDDEMYTKVVDDILFNSALTRDPNGFTIEKYREYISKDETNSHQKWHNYIIRRRQRTINDILNS